MGSALVGVALILCACDGAPHRPTADGATNDASSPMPDGSSPDALLDDGGLPVGNDGDIEQGIRPDGKPIDPTLDTDKDGLPDFFEALSPRLDPNKKDSDGDSIPDANEDDDQDGLTAAEELQAYRATATASQRKPSPARRDLLIELDYQSGMLPSQSALLEMVKAYAAVNLSNIDGSKGISLHIFVDEKNLPVKPMGEALSGRLNYLGAHGVKALAGLPAKKMVHVIFASTRPGAATRGGETVASTKASAEKAGVLVYGGNLAKIFPRCAAPGATKISAEEVVISTFVHEVGHTLQLGHDTSAGGGINPYNIMSTDLGTCQKLRKRTRGEGNADTTLGATPGNAPRFSAAAATLMKLTNKISVEAKEFEKGSGYEM